MSKFTHIFEGTPTGSSSTEYVSIMQKHPTSSEAHKSSLALNSRGYEKSLVVVGVLSHGAAFEPASPEDADKLIAWLTQWKQSKGGEQPPSASQPPPQM